MIDTSIYEIPVLKSTGRITHDHDSSYDYNYIYNDKVDHELEAQEEIVLQKKIKKRNKKFGKPEIRELTREFPNELKHVWNSDPAKQAKNVYDSGEIKELNKTWEKEAVRRDLKRGLVRVSTGRPVYWSEPLGKWIDLAKDDGCNWK